MVKLIQRIPLYILLCFFGFANAAHAQTDSLAQNKTTITANDTINQNKETTLEQLEAPSLSDVVSGAKIAWTIVFLVFGYLAIKISIGLLTAYAKRHPKQSLLFKRITPIFRIFSWLFLVYLIVVGIYAPPATTLIAFLASIGVAIGFAAQDLVKNIFGGLVVMFDRPFQIGDKIDTGGQYGEVIEIGIRSTKIVTPDDSVITIPNSDFMSSFVSNSNSGESNCQVVAEIYLPLNIDTEKVRKIATEAALISKYIFLNKPIAVLFFNEIHFNQSVYKMRLKAYVSDLSKEFAFKSEMTEIVVKTLIDEGILPFTNPINSN